MVVYRRGIVGWVGDGCLTIGCGEYEGRGGYWV